MCMDFDKTKLHSVVNKMIEKYLSNISQTAVENESLSCELQGRCPEKVRSFILYSIPPLMLHR